MPAPFSKGAFGTGTDRFAPKSPPCQRGEGRRTQSGGGGILHDEPESGLVQGRPLAAHVFFLEYLVWNTESPSHLLRKCQPPLTRGPLERKRTSQRRKAPLAKGGRAAGRSPVAGGFYMTNPRVALCRGGRWPPMCFFWSILFGIRNPPVICFANASPL